MVHLLLKTGAARGLYFYPAPTYHHFWTVFSTSLTFQVPHMLLEPKVPHVRQAIELIVNQA